MILLRVPTERSGDGTSFGTLAAWGSGGQQVVIPPRLFHDESYKRLLASPLMVQDVLRDCLPAHRLAAADLSSLGELSPEYVSDELRTRHGDTVWHLRLGRRRAFLLVL